MMPHKGKIKYIYNGKIKENIFTYYGIEREVTVEKKKENRGWNWSK